MPHLPMLSVVEKTEAFCLIIKVLPKYHLDGEWAA
jgi:hypothetical protein